MATESSTARAWQAEPDEAEAVARLIIGFRDHMGRDWPSDNAMLAGVERLMEDVGTTYLLAAADDDSPPGGLIQLRFRHSLWTAAPDCWLEDLYVDPAARRRGVGDALVGLALDVARERGSRRVELDTSEDNEAARALYARHGFSGKSKGGVRDLFLGVTLAEP
ncbi:MAG: GNAT family N-acetyltransferase [Thermoleophilaceae bacterium]